MEKPGLTQLAQCHTRKRGKQMRKTVPTLRVVKTGTAAEQFWDYVLLDVGIVVQRTFIDQRNSLTSGNIPERAAKSLLHA